MSCGVGSHRQGPPLATVLPETPGPCCAESGNNKNGLVSFFSPFFFYRSSSALHRRSSTEIRPHNWGTFCAGVCPMCVFSVSGSSRIRTHVLVIRRRTP